MPYEYEYPRPALSVDMVVRRKSATGESILLIERRNDPFAGSYALPGGFMEIDETLEQAAVRELEEETGLSEVVSLKQIAAYSSVDRDPRGRIITVAFEVVVPDDAVASAADDARSLAWFPLDELPDLAFDHAEIIRRATQHHGTAEL